MRIVQKYGGTSVADIARLENVALRIKRDVDQGHQIAVVVSAMAGLPINWLPTRKPFPIFKIAPSMTPSFQQVNKLPPVC